MKFITTIYGIEGAHASPYRTKIQLPFGWRLHKFLTALGTITLTISGRSRFTTMPKKFLTPRPAKSKSIS